MNRSGLFTVQKGESSMTVAPVDEKAVVDFSLRRSPFVCTADGIMDIPVASSGPGAVLPDTILDHFDKVARTHKDVVALKWEIGADYEQIQERTYGEYHLMVRNSAKSLMKLGVQRFGCVSIMGFNSMEWFVGAVAAMYVGAKAAGIYTTNGPKECAYIVGHSESSVVIVENNATLKKFLDYEGGDLDKVTTIIVFKEEPSIGADTKFDILSWSQFLDLGADLPDAELDARRQEVVPGQAAFLIYTSGTTGAPKAVMISHDNLSFTGKMILQGQWARNYKTMGNDKIQCMVSFLPLSHIAGIIIDMVMPLLITSETDRRCELWFARPDALKGSIPKTLQKAMPTQFFAVPRLWEKFQENMIAKSKATPMGYIKQCLVNWAKGTGKAEFDAHCLTLDDIMPSGPFCGWTARKVVHTKVWDALGLSNCAKYCITGAAPISEDTIKFFGQFGIHIHEVFGMSECTGPSAFSDIGTLLPGCVGLPIVSTEIKLEHDAGRDKEGQGEICFRGRHVMMGYLKDEEKTREVIDNEGWLHSGDVGSFDLKSRACGRLKITGRIKELMITAGGENIAPVPIEDALKSALPGIANCMVVGDRRKYNTVLITLHQKLDETVSPTDALTGPSLEIDSSVSCIQDAMASDVIKQYIADGLKKYNSEIAVSNAAKVQYFRLVPKDFTIGGGELTPTLKLKRPVVVKKYETIIEEMY